MIFFHNFEPKDALFDLGSVTINTEAVMLFAEADQSTFPMLQRHVSGDWGTMPVSEYDKNKEVLDNKTGIIRSYYLTKKSKRVYFATDLDAKETIISHAEYVRQ